jgi:hypothetical protein
VVHQPIDDARPLRLETKMRRQRGPQNDWEAAVDPIEEKVHALTEAMVCTWRTSRGGIPGLLCS